MKPSQLESSPSSARPISLSDFLVVLFAFLAVILLRFHSLTEPLEIDEANHAVIAREWSLGRQPYVDIWDNKPIGTFVVHRVARALYGDEERALKYFSLLASLMTTLLLFVVLRRRLAAWAAAGLLAVWVPLTCFAPAYANGANVEIYLLPLLVGSYWFADRYWDHARNEDLIGLIGLLLVASCIKEVTLPFFAVPWVLYGRAGGWSWARALASAGALAALVVGFTFCVYGVLGFGPGLVWSHLIKNGVYLGAGGHKTLLAQVLTFVLFPFNQAIFLLLPITGAALAGLGMGLSKARGRPAGLAALYFLCAMVAVVLPGRKYAHYFILVLPFLVLGFAAFCRAWENKRFFAYAVANAVLILITITWTSYLRFKPEDLSDSKYAWGGKYWFVRDRFIGQEMRKNGLTGRRLFVEGNHSPIYFYSLNHPATQYLNDYYYTDPRVTTPQETLAVLQLAPPELIVLADPGPSAFQGWIDLHYRLLTPLAEARIYVLAEVPGRSS